jgi:hypothetical protein
MVALHILVEAHVRFDQSLLHHMEIAPDEPGRRLVALQRKLIIHCSLKVPEETHIKALEDVIGVRGQGDDLNSVTCWQSQYVRSHMNPTIVHHQESVFVSTFFIRSELVNLVKENFRNTFKEECRIHVWLVSLSQDQIDPHSESVSLQPCLHSHIDLGTNKQRHYVLPGS